MTWGNIAGSLAPAPGCSKQLPKLSALPYQQVNFLGCFFLPSTSGPLGKLLLNLCNAGRSAPSGSTLLPSSPFPQLASSPLAFFAQPKFLFLSQPSFCWRKGAGTQALCTAPSPHVPVPQSTARGTKAEPQRGQWTKDFAMRFLI